MSTTSTITATDITLVHLNAHDANGACVPYADGAASGDARTYILPDILRNWPYKDLLINPHYHAAQEESVGWLEGFHPFSLTGQKAFNKCDFSLFSALVYPKATHYNLRSCCDLMHAFFVLDEYTDILEAGATRIQCEATMDAVLHPDNPRPEGETIIGEITRQFWKRASVHVPQATKERFVNTWQNYLDSVILQAQRRDTSRYVCTIEEYMVSRRDNIGSYPTLAFLEISLELDIPRHVMQHPLLAELNRDVTDMLILSNDMYSYKKEILVDDADYNIVTVVIKNNNTDIEGAIQWISDRHDEIIENFLKVRDDVLNKIGFPSLGEDLDNQVATYIDGLGQLIRGHEEWNFRSGRYFGDEGLEIQQTRKVVIGRPRSS